MPHKWLNKERTEIGYKPDWQKGVVWGQELGRPECPYLKRWVVNFGKFSIRLHHWIGSDDPRYMHDHPWGFFTFVIKGGYTDVTETGEEHLGAGSLTYRDAHHKHTVQTDPGGAWTLLLVGPFKRKWGFWVDGEFVGVRKYFRKFGHHPCIDDEPT